MLNVVLTLIDLQKITRFGDQILDELNLGISVQDRNFNVIYENKTVISMVGSYLGCQCYLRWEYLGQRGQCPDCPVKKTINTNEPYRILRKVRTPNDDMIYLEIYHLPIIDQNSNLSKFVNSPNNNSQQCIEQIKF